MYRRGFTKHLHFKNPFYRGSEKPGNLKGPEALMQLKELREIYGTSLAAGFPDSTTAEAVMTSFGLETVEELVEEYECR